jgi:hypothetical protein
LAGIIAYQIDQFFHTIARDNRTSTDGQANIAQTVVAM